MFIVCYTNLGETITDLNNTVVRDVTPNKLYVRQYAASASNAPEVTPGTLYNMFIDGTPYATQLAVNLNRNIFTRSKNNGTWSNWEGYAKNSDLWKLNFEVFTADPTQKNIDSITISPGIHMLTATTSGTKPFEYGVIIHIKRSDVEFIQMSIGTITDQLSTRAYFNGKWSAWREK